MASLGTAGNGLEGNISILSTELITTAPAYCKVLAVAKPTSDSNINIEVQLPFATEWNGKYMSSFEGGFAGATYDFIMAANRVRGYATAATDTGHTASDLEWTVGHPEKVVDYGYRGKHLQNVIAKALIKSYYGKLPDYSYFNGCSNGGRQAMMELQRYDDFDGYIVGAPANNWTGQTTYWAQMNKIFTDPAARIPDEKIPAIEAAALAQGDSLDGVTDKVISNPLAFKFNPDVLACSAGVDSKDCLTAPQLSALKKIYEGPQNSAGRQLFPPAEPGTETINMNFKGFVSGEESARNILGYPTIAGMLFNSKTYDPLSFDFDVDAQRLETVLGPILNATNPDLSKQKARGIKIIHYHGWGDSALSPRESINYYNKVQAAVGGLAQTQDFYRLYMVPGMVHCSGGYGPNAFGEHLAPYISSAPPEEDIVKSLEQWVEKGIAPTSIIATKFVDDNPEKGIAAKRPLCPYPQVQRYVGGDANQTSSFVCAVP